MAENVIDTLQLNIVVNTKQNGQSITTLRKSLEKLYKFLNGVKDQDFSKISSDIAKIGNSLTPLINAVNSLDGQGLKNLTSLGTRLKTLDKRMGEIDAKAMAHKFDLMTQSITPFIDKVMSAQEALVALNNVMGGAKTLTKTATPKATTTTTPKATTNTNILGGKLGKSLNFGSMIAKLYFVRNITKQLGQSLAQVVQYGIDYQETLNLWQTAMRGNISQARTFVSEMNKAYGISSATVMNYQAVFKNMLSALGNFEDENVPYAISESLTQMALDFASLYNVSVESAMTKFQAVLSGQVRPIRTAGYDITEQTLFQLYQSLGGTKTVRQLDQTEKQLLRILAVFEQMKRSGATGDLAKTLGSSANQLRMMKEQGREFATWIGISFQTLMEKSGILIGINTALYVAVELARSLAYSLGYAEPDWGIDFAEGVGEAEKEVDKLKGKLLGFDKFQVLQSGVGTDGVDIEDNLVKALEEYQSLFKGVDNPAVKNATSILEALGGELVDVKNESGEVVGQIWQLPPALTEAVKLIGSLAAALATLGLIALEKKLWSVVKGITGVGNAMTLLRVGGLGLLIYGLANLITKWDELSIGMKIVYGAITLLGAAMIFFSSTTLKKHFITQLLAAQLQLGSFGKAITMVTAQTVSLAVGIGLIVSGFSDLQNWSDMSSLERASTILKIVAGAAFLAATAIASFHTAWSVGVAAATIAVGVAAIVASMITAQQAAKDMEKNVQMKAVGGLATKGSLFYAGEAGPELVTQTSGGGSTIMNMKQLEDAVARGFIRGFASTDKGYEDTDETNVYVDGQRLFNIMRNTAKRNGYDFVRV